MMKLKYLVERDYLVLNEDDLISLRMPEILLSKRNLFPVISTDRSFKGLVFVEDVLKRNISEADNLSVNDLMHTAPDFVVITDPLKKVLEKMEKENAWLLPVLDEAGAYLGFVSKTAIFNKYRALLSRQADYME
jgi:CIC family chloride channel protein